MTATDATSEQGRCRFYSRCGYGYEEAGSMNHRRYWYAECTKCGQLHLLSSKQLVRNAYAESCGQCPIDDLTGNTYERLTVRKYSHKRNDKHYWLCDCSCGNEHVVQASHLKSSKTKSCGCLARELAQERKLVHGGMLNHTHTRAQPGITCIKGCTLPR